MSTYVVIDLEMCKVPKGFRREKYPHSQEIIQIGAVAMNEEYQIVDSFMTLIKPEHGLIDAKIQQLTGISPSDVKDAPYMKAAWESFSAWLPKDARFVAWSDSDTKQIIKELTIKEIDFESMQPQFEEYIDCQIVFSEKMKTEKVYRLSEALIIADIDFDENIHDALVDAKNTALLFAKTQLEEELSLSKYLVTEDDMDSAFSNYKYKKNYV